MQITLAKTSQLSSMMDIVLDAQKYLAQLGIDQWQNGKWKINGKISRGSKPRAQFLHVAA